MDAGRHFPQREVLGPPNHFLQAGARDPRDRALFELVGEREQRPGEQRSHDRAGEDERREDARAQATAAAHLLSRADSPPSARCAGAAARTGDRSPGAAYGYGRAARRSPAALRPRARSRAGIAARRRAIRASGCAEAGSPALRARLAFRLALPTWCARPARDPRPAAAVVGARLANDAAARAGAPRARAAEPALRGSRRRQAPGRRSGPRARLEP